MIARPTLVRTPPFAIDFGVIHYESYENVSWHFKIEVAKIDDPSFGTILLSKESKVSQTGWYFRDEHKVTASSPTIDQRFVAVGSGGVATKLSQAPLPSKRVGTAQFLVNVLADMKKFARGQSYRVRCYQWNGTTYSTTPFTKEITIA